jgi:hypothetical protein
VVGGLSGGAEGSPRAADGSVPGGAIAEHCGRTDRGAGTGVGTTHDGRAGVPGGVETLDHGPVGVEHAGVVVGEDAALGAKVARHDLYGGERALPWENGVSRMPEPFFEDMGRKAERFPEIHGSDDHELLDRIRDLAVAHVKVIRGARLSRLDPGGGTIDKAAVLVGAGPMTTQHPLAPAPAGAVEIGEEVAC